MGFSGDVGELDRMAEEIGKKAEAMPTIVAEAAKGIDRVLTGTIGSGVTPYMSKWAALRNGGEPSGSILHRVSVVVKGARIQAKTDKIASYHNRGTSKMVARQLIPSEAQGLPEGWREPIDAASDRAMEGR